MPAAQQNEYSSTSVCALGFIEFHHKAGCNRESQRSESPGVRGYMGLFFRLMDLMELMELMRVKVLPLSTRIEPVSIANKN